MKLKLAALTLLFLISSARLSYSQTQSCQVSPEMTDAILAEVRKKIPNTIRDLPECYLANYDLMLQVGLIDPQQFQYFAINLKNDREFVYRLVKLDPTILQYALRYMLSDQVFMEWTSYLNRDTLQYASPELLDDKPFMKKMITLDSRNYLFASARLKEMPDIAAIAFADNGLLLANAPEKIRQDKSLVKIAVTSSASAYDYALLDAKLDKTIITLSKQNPTIRPPLLTEEKLKKFLQKNYIKAIKERNLGVEVTNRAKFSKSNQLVTRNYITKWQNRLNYKPTEIAEDLLLITAHSRNYPIFWKQDFRKYPELIQKIEKFFLTRNVNQSTIDALSTVDLWVVKKKPLTLAFSLYLLRDSLGSKLGNEFADITSLTAIAQQRGKKWRLTVVEVLFDCDTRVDLTYPNGHKKYLLWDLYKINSKDKSPKIIFKIEEPFKESFEIFVEENGGKYRSIHNISSKDIEPVVNPQPESEL